MKLHNQLLKVLKLNAPTLPVGLVKFCNGLLDIKTPISFFKDADSLNIRKALISLRKQVTAPERQEVTNDVEGDSEGNGEKESVEESTNEVQVAPSQSEIDQTVKKRKTKQKLAPESDPYGAEPPRRSKRLRLKEEIDENWSPLNGYE